MKHVMQNVRELEHSQQWCYIGILVFFNSSNTKKHTPAVELNLFFLAPLLQCISIDRCALFMRAKKYILFLLNFSLLFHLKNIFSFFFSLRLLFFLPFSFSFFFSPSSTLCFADLFWIFIIADLHHHHPHCHPTLLTHLAQSSISPLTQR